MPKKCCIPSCRIQEDDPAGLNLSFFQVPKDEARKDKWIANAKKYLKAKIELKKFSYVCSLHFEQTSYSLGPMGIRLRLKKEACPTIFHEKLSNISDHVTRDDSLKSIKLFGDNSSQAEEKIHGDESNSNYSRCNSIVEFCSNNDQTNIRNVSIDNIQIDTTSSESNEVGQSIKTFGDISDKAVIVRENHICSVDKTQTDLISFQASDNRQNDDSIRFDNNDGSKITSANKSNESLNWNNSAKNYQKSFANINLDTINYKDETVVRSLLEKAQREIKDVRRKFRLQAMKLYRANRKQKTPCGMMNDMKNRTLLNKKLSQMLSKKALQALKTPKPEPERIPQAPKRPTEARDAREVAKKLIKSGVITAIPKTPKRPEQSFKRPRGLERKLNSTEKTVSSYQPFSATVPEEEDVDTARPKVKDLYDSFVSARDPEDRGTAEKPPQARSEVKPRAGNTIFVYGHKISEDFLKKHFQTFGNIVNISMESEKNRGFVTFDKPEVAERAISEMNGSMVSSIQLTVSLARRQPVIDPVNDTSSSFMWTSIAASYSQKSAYKDRRDLKVYDEDFFE